MSCKDQSHRRDLEELSEVIDEMQSDGMKKDYEMDELVQKLYQLQERAGKTAQNFMEGTTMIKVRSKSHIISNQYKKPTK